MLAGGFGRSVPAVLEIVTSVQAGEPVSVRGPRRPLTVMRPTVPSPPARVSVVGDFTATGTSSVSPTVRQPQVAQVF